MLIKQRVVQNSIINAPVPCMHWECTKSTADSEPWSKYTCVGEFYPEKTKRCSVLYQQYFKISDAGALGYFSWPCPNDILAFVSFRMIVDVNNNIQNYQSSWILIQHVENLSRLWNFVINDWLNFHAYEWKVMSNILQIWIPSARIYNTFICW